MKQDDRVKLQERIIAYRPVFADISGSIPGALFLSQSLYWQSRCLPGRDGWWWKTADEWFKETRLTRREQQQARKVLNRLMILEEEKKGVPCRLWFRLNLNELDSAIQNATKRQTCLSTKQVNRDAAGKFAKKSDACDPGSGMPISETTLETTPDISSDKPAAGGGSRKGYQSKREQLRFENEFGLVWSPAHQMLLDEARAVSIMKSMGIEDPGIARLVIAEWSAMNSRGLDRTDPAGALAWACRRAMDPDSEPLALTCKGEARLPSWA